MKWVLLILILGNGTSCSTTKNITDYQTPIAVSPVLAEYVVPVDVRSTSTNDYSINVVSYAAPYN